MTKPDDGQFDENALILLVESLIRHCCASDGHAIRRAASLAIEWKRFPADEDHLWHVLDIYEREKLSKELCGLGHSFVKYELMPLLKKRKTNQTNPKRANIMKKTLSALLALPKSPMVI